MAVEVRRNNRAFIVLDTEWREKMRRLEAKYCARCGNEQNHARCYKVVCVGGKRHIWKWSL